MTIIGKIIAKTVLATAAPTVTDDRSKGYGLGMQWINVTAGDSYYLKSNAVGAAVWVSYASGGSSVTSVQGMTGVVSLTFTDIPGLLAGTNITITDNLDGTATIAASGGGGGGTITDWQSEATTIHAVTTNPTKGGTITRDKIYWRRVGDSMECRIDYRQTAGGTIGSGAYLFALPAAAGAVTIDSTKVAFMTTSQLWAGAVGAGTISDETTSSRFVEIGVYDTTHIKIYDFVSGEVGSGNSLVSLNNAKVNYSVFYTLPITEWA